MSRILLVKPPFARLLQNDVYLTYPLGLMYVSAMLKAAGHEVIIYHDDVSNPAPIPRGRVQLGRVERQELGEESYGPFIEALDSFQPDVVGMSYCTVDHDAAHAFSGFVRQRGIRLVAGGIHPSLLPDDEAIAFNSVVVGEGDSPLAEHAFTNDNIEILSVMPVDDLDRFLPDRFGVIGAERYSPLLHGLVQTQRGCPYACSYCAAPKVFGTKVRTRDPGAVRDEVESLCTKQGRIIDDSFGVLRGHALRVCAELEKTDFSWVCDAALQNIDQTLIEALVAGGCTCVNVGIESAVARWRELSGKNVTQEQTEATLALANAQGLSMVCYFMIGFPGETADELVHTLTWARRLKDLGAKPHISIATPYPETKLWELAQGRRTNGWSGYFHQSGEMGMADCTEDEWAAAIQEANSVNA